MNKTDQPLKKIEKIEDFTKPAIVKDGVGISEIFFEKFEGNDRNRKEKFERIYNQPESSVIKTLKYEKKKVELMNMTEEKRMKRYIDAIQQQEDEMCKENALKRREEAV